MSSTPIPLPGVSKEQLSASNKLGIQIEWSYRVLPQYIIN